MRVRKLLTCASLVVHPLALSICLTFRDSPFAGIHLDAGHAIGKGPDPITDTSSGN